MTRHVPHSTRARSAIALFTSLLTVSLGAGCSCGGPPAAIVVVGDGSVPFDAASVTAVCLEAHIATLVVGPGPGCVGLDLLGTGSARCAVGEAGDAAGTPFRIVRLGDLPVRALDVALRRGAL